MDSSLQNNLKEKYLQLINENIEENEEHSNKGKYKKKNIFPNFLLKLYNILENDECKDIIQWGENGKYFVVKNIHDFTEKILPKYFKHSNYSSFIRQLNMYDFHKKKSNQNEHLFHHKNFIKGQKDLMKEIKRKSNKKDENVPIASNPLDNIAYTDLVKYSCKNALKDINININKRKSSLSLDEDDSLNKSMHSLFESNKRPYLPYGKYVSNICCKNNEKYLANGLLNCINNVNSNINIGIPIKNSDKKITKQNLNNLLNQLNNEIMVNNQMEKNLEMKMEILSKQNEEFIQKNQKMLDDILSKKDYNKKLEAVICFILDIIMTKPKIKNYPELENIFLSNDSNKKLKSGNNRLNFNIFNNSSPEINILPKNDYKQINGDLEPFQTFLNRYLEKSNKTGLLGEKENNISSLNNANSLKTNLICCKDEKDNLFSNSLICKKRKRSNSLNSLLSDLSNGTKIVYSENKNKKNFESNEKLEKIEEKKLENESFDNSDNSIINNIEYNENENDSFFSSNKSKNLFDLDLTQEENKTDIIDINKDILNNSKEYFNDVYNRSNIIKDNDVFSDINN
jgi:heat shock transcription factor 1